MKIKMTKKQVVKIFNEEYMPGLREQERLNGKIDLGARRMAWAVLTDSMNKDGLITDSQFFRWTAPKTVTG